MDKMIIIDEEVLELQLKKGKDIILRIHQDIQALSDSAEASELIDSLIELCVFEENRFELALKACDMYRACDEELVAIISEALSE